MENRASLRDIAEKAGVSKATVSLALRDHPRISPPMRAKIRAIADELGYTPDPVISRIAANGWNARREQGHTTLGFLTGAGAAGAPSRVGFSHFEPMQRLAPRLGYKVDHFLLQDFRNPERLADVLEARGIRGLLLHAIDDEAFVRKFPWNRFASVACSLSIAMPPVHLVTSDYCYPVLRTWERCLAAGYRRIGVALFKEMSPHDDLPRSGLAEYLGRTALPRQADALPVEHFSIRDKDKFLAWVKASRPDLVIGLNETIYWWLHEGGYRMPEDLGFVALIVKPARPQLISGWNSRDDLVAKSSLEQLDLLMRSAEVGLPVSPYTLLIRPSWENGSTLRGEAPAAPAA